MKYMHMQRRKGHKAATLASGRLLQRLPQLLLNGRAADAAGDIRPLANDGVSKGSDGAVAELAASVADEAIAELADDKNLLKGRVPQVDDWVDAWAESTEQVSFRKQARIWTKKGGCARARNLRQIRRKQLKIIAEVRRQDIREQLRRATSIGLSMDERRDTKVVRVRCDAPTKLFVHRRGLGVLSLEIGSCRF